MPVPWVATPMALVVNADWWENLDETSKEVFTLAFETPSTHEFLEKYENQLVADWGVKTENTWKAPLTEEQEEAWKKILNDAGKSFTNDMPKELLDAIERTR